MTGPLRYEQGKLWLLDQTQLPHREVWHGYDDHCGVEQAIRTMVVRGAPAIGVAAAFGVALGARHIAAEGEQFHRRLGEIAARLAAARPTAVNLAWAVSRMTQLAGRLRGLPAAEIKRRLLAEAQTMAEEDAAANLAIGRHGQELLGDRCRVLTHCNAGALATCGYGTALAVIRAAVEKGKQISVLADETRPCLQGARLTAYELMRDGIEVTLICDNMAGYCMRQGMVDCVIVGADRIAANGDTANKIGTYPLAVLASEHGIPFYVAAPVSTIDPALAGGSQIPIEQRGEEEVTHLAGQPVAPAGVKVLNPSFDVTPARYITAIVTERGIVRPPYAF
ncbi:MAG: S-methyl-5-thioribose-1-phosphate isomerase [Negativicutes bacterium]|nr:S-methyl-5-thioribose-1-phosphate isomerase [Negativicutes bacterium]